MVRGPKKLWPERVHVLLPAGAKARIEAVLAEEETTLDLIRSAIDTECTRRERLAESADRSDGTPSTPDR